MLLPISNPSLPYAENKQIVVNNNAFSILKVAARKLLQLKGVPTVRPNLSMGCVFY